MQKVKIKNQIIKLKDHQAVWMPTRFGIALGEILLAGPKPNSSVLELGCGSGVLTILCGKLGTKVTALDINPSAISLTKRNWQINGLPSGNLCALESDLFSALDSGENNQFSLIFSNPPTFPGLARNRHSRKTRNDWELAGGDGREVLDAMITQAGKFLKPGGRMVTIATSRQGWKKTVALMNENWPIWKLIKTEDLPLAPHYAPFIQLWLEDGEADNEERIFLKDGVWHQRLYFIEGRKG
jgi:methylase of polypeptide subunit release factors